jgi:hypothetical protein
LHERRHIVIAGPGRSGTTLLVRLLDRLGLDIGDPELGYYEPIRAGLESELLAPNAPRVVKKPALTWLLGDMLASGAITADRIEWLVIPLRNLDDAAASRIRISVQHRDVRALGGLVRTYRPAKQRAELAETTYGLIQTAAFHELPLILLEYPRFAQDVDYAYRRLEPMLPTVSREDFHTAWSDIVDPKLVRDGPLDVPRFAGAKIAALRIRRWVKRKFVS